MYSICLINSCGWKSLWVEYDRGEGQFQNSGASFSFQFGLAGAWKVCPIRRWHGCLVHDHSRGQKASLHSLPSDLWPWGKLDAVCVHLCCDLCPVCSEAGCSLFLRPRQGLSTMPDPPSKAHYHARPSEQVGFYQRLPSRQSEELEFTSSMPTAHSYPAVLTQQDLESETSEQKQCQRYHLQGNFRS